MEFELLDRYLLEAEPAKADVIKALLAKRSEVTAAQPFYEGMRMLGVRTPDLTLVALRLVLAGKKADDESVVALRDLAQRARSGEGASARDAYMKALA
jgi:hypothetical protein